MMTLGLALIVAATTAPSRSAPKPDLLVSAAWLGQHQKDPDLIILQVDHDRTEYDRGHIPGARFVSAMAFMTHAEPGVEIPPVARLDSLVESLGISNRSRVILYGGTWSLPRAFLALDYLGHGDRTAVLDGGMTAWRAAGLPTSTESPVVQRGRFTPAVRTDLVVDANWVKQHLDDPRVALVDGRSAEEYNGTTQAERLPRYGHLPGATLLPWDQTFTNPSGALEGTSSVLVPRERLAKLLADAGGTDGRQIVTYCTVGLRASHLYFVARLLGYSPKIYDGSMKDWAPRTELPLVGTKTAAPQGLGAIITPSWLAQHRNDSKLVLLHVDRNSAAYDSAHIAGARFVAFSQFTPAKAGLPTELPEAAEFSALLGSLGANQDSYFVLYGDVLAASRFYFTLDSFGWGDRAAVLDGGLSGWRRAGYEVTAVVPSAAAPGTVSLTDGGRHGADASLVERMSREKDAVILDARQPAEYEGTVAEDGVARAGHIPGARNLDWTLTMKDGSFRTPTELRQLFQDHGVKDGSAIVTYCRVGTRASVLYLVARQLGYHVMMYDGSMVDWTRRPDLAVATGPEPGTPR